MKNTTSKVQLYALMAKALVALLLPVSLLAVDLDLRRVGGYEHLKEIRSRVAVSGKYVYAGGTVIDVSDPANPREITRHDTSGWRYGLPVSTNFTYAPDPDETWMVTDVSDPVHPQVVGGYKTMALAFGVKVSGKYAYRINTEKTFQVVDVIEISDPANPQKVGSYEANYAYDVAISGNYAHVAAADDGLQILDISNPTRPTLRGSMRINDNALSVGVTGNYALVGGVKGLHVVDVRNPASPQPIGQPLWTEEPVHNICISGNYACSTGYGSVVLFDISDPRTPKFAGGSEGLDEYATGVALSGNYAYFVGFFRGMHVIEIRPANPQRLANLQFGTDTSEHGPGGFATAVAVSGNYAYVTDDEAGVQVIDISDTSNPRRIGGYGTRGEFHGVAVSGNYAYVGGDLWDGSDFLGSGLHVLDISNPANPSRGGGTSFPGNFSGPVISGNYAYVTGYSYTLGDGVYVFDLSSPTNPRQVGRYHPAGYSSQLVVSGMYAYVTTFGSYSGTNYLGGGSLEVVDISDPANPRRMGNYDTFYSATSLAVSGRYAYVTIGEDYSIGNLMKIDISDPRNPRRIGTYASDFFSVAASGDFIYASGTAGLEVIDFSNPADPRRVGGNSAVFPLYDGSRAAISGERFFVAAAEQGFVIVDLFRPFRLELLTHSGPGLSLRLDGPRGVVAQIQRSTNLADWEDWKPIIFGTAPMEVSDPEPATKPRRFYRAVNH